MPSHTVSRPVSRVPSRLPTRLGLIGKTMDLIDRMTTQPNSARIKAVDGVFRGLDSYGITPRLDCLWFMAAANSQAARLNWLSSSYTLTAVNSPTFTADRGYNGDAVSAYLNTGFTASTAGGKYTQNDMSMGVYVRALNTAGVWFGAQAGVSSGWTQIQDTTSAFIYRANAGTNSTSTAVLTPSLNVTERTSSTDIRYIQNGAAAGTASVASDGVPDRPFFLLCRNRAFGPSPDPGNFTSAQFSMSYIGGSLTDAQHAALNSIVTEYLTAVGAI